MKINLLLKKIMKNVTVSAITVIAMKDPEMALASQNVSAIAKIAIAMENPKGIVAINK